MTAVLIATLGAAGFCASGLLALFASPLNARGRSYTIAVAAGILLALAFSSLFPEGLELAGQPAIAAFVSAFAVLFLIETFTRAHTYHAPDEDLHTHALMPFLLGLLIHNVADGFAVGVSAKHAWSSSALVGLGVVIHQVPVGLSLAAVFAAAHAPATHMIRATLLLGLAIPFATLITLTLPALGEASVGILTAAAAGMLAYMGTNHLLPEAQAEHPSRSTGIVFTVTLLLTTSAIFAIGEG